MGFHEFNCIKHSLWSIADLPTYRGNLHFGKDGSNRTDDYTESNQMHNCSVWLDPNSNTHNYYSFTPINSVGAYVVVWQIVIVVVVVVVFENVVIVRCALALIRLRWIYMHIPSSPNDDVIFCAIEYMDFCLSISFHPFNSTFDLDSTSSSMDLHSNFKLEFEAQKSPDRKKSNAIGRAKFANIL